MTENSDPKSQHHKILFLCDINPKMYSLFYKTVSFESRKKVDALLLNNEGWGLGKKAASILAFVWDEKCATFDIIFSEFPVYFHTTSKVA